MNTLINTLKARYQSKTANQKKWYCIAAAWIVVALSQTGFLLGLVMAGVGVFLFMNIDWLDKAETSSSTSTEDK